MKARLLVGTVVALIAALAVVLQPGPPAGYVHTGNDKTFDRGRWATICTVPMPSKGWVHVGAQIPIRVTKGLTPRLVKVVFVRQPSNDGTANVTESVVSRRWSLTHWHTIKGFKGRIEVRVMVPGKGKWVNPWRVCKTVPT